MKVEYCDLCSHLNYTEDEQNRLKANTGNKPDHRCTLLDQRLLHLDYHPHILKPTNCPLPKKDTMSRGSE